MTNEIFLFLFSKVSKRKLYAEIFLHGNLTGDSKRQCSLNMLDFPYHTIKFMEALVLNGHHIALIIMRQMAMDNLNLLIALH